MALTARSVDVLRWPVIGRFLRWRHARTALQLVMLALAAVTVAHGLFGPQLAFTNLATIVTWVHYRGLLVVALLAAGNLFCSGCPLILARNATRRLHAPTWRWPRLLRTKWLSLLLFAAVLFSYELFDLWALPRATALLILAYFVSVIVIDTLFAGAAFCKYVCPVGQFNFAMSTVSPLEVRVRELSTCHTCTTFDCIKGRAATSQQPAQRGCELALFQPLKVGNLDCTFCFDCVQACPHDNVGLIGRVPGTELADPRRRSGVGRLTERRDLQALAALFVFGAFVNASGMIAPLVAVEQRVADITRLSHEAPVLALIFVAGLVLVPIACIGIAAHTTRFLTADTRPVAAIGRCFTFGLVPFGAGLWAAHYAFHLLTALLTVVPVVQSAVFDAIGSHLLGDPQWRFSGFTPGSVFPIELGFVVLGALGSGAVTAAIADRDYPRGAARAAAPWLALVGLLSAAALWLIAQPMNMRSFGGG